MIDHRKPVLIAEGLKRLPFPKFQEVQLYPLPARYPFGDKLRHLIVAVFCFIVPRGKAVVAFLVLRLVEGNVGVLTDAFLDQFGGDIDLRLQIGKFPLQFVRCENRSKCTLEDTKKWNVLLYVKKRSSIPFNYSTLFNYSFGRCF